MKSEKNTNVQQIYYKNKKYEILSIEQDFMIHPVVFGMLPLSVASLSTSFFCSFSMVGYQLYLNDIRLDDKKGDTDSSIYITQYSEEHKKYHLPIYFNGTILIAKDLDKDFMAVGKDYPCISYQHVLELVFNKGVLETTIDHSRAMARVRKNLKLGLRNLNNKRDMRCIKRFLNSSFIGEYKLISDLEIKKGFKETLKIRKKLKYLEQLKYYYQSDPAEK